MSIITVILFLIGFALLYIGGGAFVEGAVRLSEHYELRKETIGATIVSIGTTLPEVVVSCSAAFKGSAGISYGNAIGSVICNTALVLALIIALRKQSTTRIDKKAFRVPAAFFFGAAIIYSVNAWVRGRFDRWIGVLLLLIFAAYMFVSVKHMKDDSDSEQDKKAKTEEERWLKKQLERLFGKPVEELLDELLDKPWKMAVCMLVGLGAIVLGSELLVKNGVIIAQALGLPDSVIGLTMVAFGTSLPELITAVKSIKKDHPRLMVGNILGANVLNIVLVSGLAMTISPFDVPAEKTIGAVNSSLIVDIPLMLLVMAVFCLPVLRSGRIRRWQGIVLLCLYAAFMVYQFM